jgi:hypothetical protein
MIFTLIVNKCGPLSIFLYLIAFCHKLGAIESASWAFAHRYYLWVEPFEHPNRVAVKVADFGEQD